MKTLTSKMIAVVILAFISVFASCTDFSDFLSNQFNETSHLSTNITVDGEIAAPILNTSFSLSNFIPKTKDSTIWVEIDNQNVIHVRFQKKNFIHYTSSDVYVCPILTPIPPTSKNVSADSSNIDIFKNALNGHIYLNDPRIKITIYNQIPILTYFSLDSMIFISSTQNHFISLPKTYINVPANNQDTGITEITIDKVSVPNIINIFADVPQFITYRINIGNDATQTYDPIEYPDICTRPFWADLDIDLPLDLRIQDLSFNDTLNFFNIKNVDQVDSATLKIFFDNEIPLGGTVDLFIADSTSSGQANNILMKPIENWDFQPGQTDVTGFTIKSTHSELILRLTHAQLDSLISQNASKIILNIKLNTYNSSTSQSVKILSTNKLNTKIGVKISYKASSSNL